MRTHCLKTWREFYGSIANGTKMFEVRKNDRDFSIGDILVLLEWDRTDETYTGCAAIRRVTYILREHDALLGGYVVMGVERVE